jgi:hypothetical protein
MLQKKLEKKEKKFGAKIVIIAKTNVNFSARQVRFTMIRKSEVEQLKSSFYCVYLRQ